MEADINTEVALLKKEVSDIKYLLYEDLWLSEKKNTNILMELSHGYKYLQNNIQ